MKKKISVFILAICMTALFLIANGCSKTSDYKKLVSEFRSDIYIGTNEEYSVFASFSQKEYPYTADGNVGSMTNIFEIVLTAPQNTKGYTVTYFIGEKSYTSDLSFDSVKMVHYCSQSLEKPSADEITFTVSETNSETFTPVSITAKSVGGANILSLDDLLEKIVTSSDETAKSIFSDQKFSGELYVRLLYDNDKCFYYVGAIDKSGKITHMLCDATTGEVIATRK